ncbi:tetratricopeptide repeat protein [Streptomyces sp. P17]|nr:tetratricopeptide repeat protein [Streptomyces sp. P17]MDT9700642.1 tetratricopeptide repeat protein [Streptomyces sp. P17]
MAFREVGRVEEAIDAHIRDRDLCQVTGDRHGEGMTWHNLAACLLDAGSAEEAIEAYGKALEVYQEFEDCYWAGHALVGLAFVHQDIHDLPGARAHYLRAVQAFTRANAPAEAAQAQSSADALT